MGGLLRRPGPRQQRRADPRGRVLIDGGRSMLRLNQKSRAPIPVDAISLSEAREALCRHVIPNLVELKEKLARGDFQAWMTARNELARALECADRQLRLTLIDRKLDGLILDPRTGQYRKLPAADWDMGLLSVPILSEKGFIADDTKAI